MSTRNFTLRPMAAADWPAVEAGYAHSFMDCRAPAIWDWRFQRQVADGWSGWIAAPAGGGIAAFVGGSHHRGWQQDENGGHEIRIVIARDNYSHPNWRAQSSGRRGLFLRSEQAFLEATGTHAAICLGIGLDRRVRLGNLAGINSPYLGGQWYRAALPAAFYLAESNNCSCRVGFTTFTEPGWDTCWEQRRERQRLGLIRDRAFLAWRFADAQGRTYWRFAIHDIASASPIGYMVFTANDGRAVLVDACLPPLPPIARAAWRQAGAWLRRQGIGEVITFSGAGCPEQPLWPELGFLPCPPPLPVAPVYRSYAAAAATMEKDYAFTLADSDLF